MAAIDFPALSTVASTEFPDIVQTTSVQENKLRVVLTDGSYVDFWWSLNIEGRYAHHWERRHIDGTIYRFDNAPHAKWRHIKSFPHHFHFKTDSDVRESTIDTNPPDSIRFTLQFARTVLITPSPHDSNL
jgi:hypothetical protein